MEGIYQVPQCLGLKDGRVSSRGAHGVEQIIEGTVEVSRDIRLYHLHLIDIIAADRDSMLHDCSDKGS